MSAKPSNSTADLTPASGLPTGSSNTCSGGHEWVVYSTALADVCLMVQCAECNTMGTIDDPSAEEWSEAFHAPSNPYRWLDGSRVRERGVAPPRVIRDAVGPPCSCPLHPGLAATSGYARIPGGITAHDRALSEEERSELLELSSLVGGSDLCSHLLPYFIRCYEADTGGKHSAATHEVVRRIERFDAKGIHCSPLVVAKILKEYANSDPVR